MTAKCSERGLLGLQRSTPWEMCYFWGRQFGRGIERTICQKSNVKQGYKERSAVNAKSANNLRNRLRVRWAECLEGVLTSSTQEQLAIGGHCESYCGKSRWEWNLFSVIRNRDRQRRLRFITHYVSPTGQDTAPHRGLMQTPSPRKKTKSTDPEDV